MNVQELNIRKTDASLQPDCDPCRNRLSHFNLVHNARCGKNDQVANFNHFFHFRYYSSFIDVFMHLAKIASQAIE